MDESVLDEPQRLPQISQQHLVSFSRRVECGQRVSLLEKLVCARLLLLASLKVIGPWFSEQLTGATQFGSRGIVLGFRSLQPAFIHLLQERVVGLFGVDIVGH